jgi:hypothetical protein
VSRTLLLAAWNSYIVGLTGILDKAPSSVDRAYQSPPPLSQEWMLATLLPLLTPAKAASGNYAKLVLDPKGVSPLTLATVQLEAWPAGRGTHSGAGAAGDSSQAAAAPLPYVLTALPCLRAVMDSLPGCDSGVVEEFVRALFNLVCRAAQAAVATTDASMQAVGRQALSGAVEALVDCLSICRSNAVALPFLDSTDALELLTLMCDSVGCSAAPAEELLPLLRDFLSNVTSRTALFKANWINAIMSSFSHKVLTGLGWCAGPSFRM